MSREIGEILSTRVTSDRDYEPAARRGTARQRPYSRSAPGVESEGDSRR